MYATCWKKDLHAFYRGNLNDLRIKAAILAYPVLDLVAPATSLDWRMLWGGKNPVAAFSEFMFGHNNPSKAELMERSPVYLINNDTCPCFIVHAQDDPIADVLGSLKMAEKLRQNNIPFSLHVFQTGGHGFVVEKELKDSIISETSYKGNWIELLDRWIREEKMY